jgi:hypothetical protein
VTAFCESKPSWEWLIFVKSTADFCSQKLVLEVFPLPQILASPIFCILSQSLKPFPK